MLTTGGNTNESTKGITDLLKDLPSYKIRSIDNMIDLFFPSIDLFIYLNRKESIIFEEIRKGKSEEETISVISKKHKISKSEALRELNNFIKEFSLSIRNER